MGMVSKELVKCRVDWPYRGAVVSIEENPGDVEPIHIHMGNNEDGWAFRLHFTYDEFKEFSEQITKGGRL